jgi:glycosyltransferase involved in cell wall biosynthesis
MAPLSMATRCAIFTICSNNYVPMAKVFVESARRNHPGATLYLCLADEKLSDEAFYPTDCEVVTADSLAIPDFREFAFRYDVVEFNTALKPFMIRHLQARGHEHVLYLDPDIEVFAPLEQVFALLDAGASFVMTPHLTRPAEREAFPDDLAIMRAGVFNLGFLGVGAGEEVDQVLRWWSRRLLYECVDDPGRGLFVDQKFMDLVPGFADGTRVLRDTAYNVAYWNLHQRTLTEESGRWLVDGRPLRFFHFSGIDPTDLSRLSKHTEAFRQLGLDAALRALMRRYADQVLANGHGSVPTGAYTYGRFASGTPIPPVVRRMFRESHVSWSGGDPFESYEEYLHLPSAQCSVASVPFVTNLMYYLHQREPWLRATYDLQGRDGAVGLADWFADHARPIVKDRRLIERAILRAGRARSGAPSRRPPVKRAHDEADATVIGYLRLALGVGEAGRQVLRALTHGGVAARGLAIHLNSKSSAVDRSLDGLLDDVSTARFEVFNVNADQLPYVLEQLDRRLRSDAYRAIVPFWELEEFPGALLGAFELVDEVWAPTRFIQAMLTRKLMKPVLHMPVPLTFEAPVASARGAVGLPEGVFLFFFAFDYLSFVTRKNPMGLVRAFKRAFRTSGDRREVALVIKTLNADVVPEEGQALRDELRDDPDVILIERTLSREETLQLIGACDAVVSLHRSEGLGLLVAEAMALGKPVISTDYSATTELVSPTTGWPVDFKLVPVGPSEYAFPAGQVWAEPDEAHAAWQMRRAFQEPAEASRRAAAGRSYLQREFGFDACARRLRGRLAELDRV